MIHSTFYKLSSSSYTKRTIKYIACIPLTQIPSCQKVREFNSYSKFVRPLISITIYNTVIPQERWTVSLLILYRSSYVPTVCVTAPRQHSLVGILHVYLVVAHHFAWLVESVERVWWKNIAKKINSPVISEISAQRASKAGKAFIWLRHHGFRVWSTTVNCLDLSQVCICAHLGIHQVHEHTPKYIHGAPSAS